MTPDHVYTDNSKEFSKAMQDLNWCRDTSTPYRPETNGVVERAVRRVKEGTASALFQSGFPEEWWDEAMTCYCFLHNVHDLLRDGMTAFERRFADGFVGPIIPFGAQVEYKPARESDVQRLHAFGKKTHAGIFIGYVQHAGGGWTGDVRVILIGKKLNKRRREPTFTSRE